MDQTPGKPWIYPLLAVALVVIVAAAGIMTLGNTSTGTPQTSGVPPEPATGSRDLFPDKAYPEYAEGYSVEYHGTYKVVQIHDPWGRAAENQTYLLVQRGEEVPDGYLEARVFYVPVESVITLSMVQVSYIASLNETASIKGHNGINLVFDEEFLKRAEQGNVTEIGSGTVSMNELLKTEIMIELEPDIVFCISNGNPEYDSHYKMREAGLNPVIDAEWMEDHPLGRAEWIKYYALFFNKEKAANEFFGKVAANYTAIRKDAINVSHKPTIFSGIDYQGTWYAPGGNSYVGRLFRDAGGDYFLKTDSGTGDIPLDFEAVYEQAHDAEFWLNIGFADNIDELLMLDPRYTKFEAYKNDRLYHFNNRLNAYGGNDYWESGMVHPDILLADVVKILHPDLLPDHMLYYYRHTSANMTGDIQ